MRFFPSYRLRIIIAALIALSFTACSGGSKAIVSGKIDGGPEPMPRSDIHYNLLGHADNQLGVQTSADGKFRFTIDKPGIYHLLVSGVNHKPFEMMLDLKQLKNLTFTVHLSPIEAPADTASLVAIGSFNHFSQVDGLIMKKQNDGTYSVVVPNDSSAVSYQIEGLDANNPVNGTKADRYVYDGNGQYVSVLQTHASRVAITYAPSKSNTGADSAAVVFSNPPQEVKAFSDAYRSMVIAQKEYWKSVRTQLKEGKSLNTVSFDWKPYRDRVEKSIKSNPSSDVYRMDLISYLSIGMYDASPLNPMYARKALKIISPDDGIWSVQPLTMLVAVNLSGNRSKYQSYIEQAAETHSDPNVKATLVYYQLTNAVQTQDEKQAQKYYKQLITEYGNTVYAQWAQQEFSMNQQVSVGSPVPDFKVTSLTNPNVTYSNKKLLGKYYLIDFWATWCGPCRGEMPYLQKAYNKFKGKDFEILSLSLDDSAGAVRNFRHNKYPMPWLHALLKGGFQNPVAEKFGVNAIPNPVLVNDKGIVVAKGVDLRGPYLAETLSQYLK